MGKSLLLLLCILSPVLSSEPGDSVRVGPEEMEGYVKLPSESCSGLDCYIYIDPLPTHTVSLRFEELWGIGPRGYATRFFYYEGEKHDYEMVFNTDLSTGVQQSLTLSSPEGYGFFINRTHASSYRPVTVPFKRIPSVETRHICPSPFVTASRIPKNVTVPKNSPSCAMRIDSPDNHMLHIHSNCSSRDLTMSVGQKDEAGRQDREDTTTKRASDLNGKWDYYPSGVDLFYYREHDYFREKEDCQITYFALDYDPCNCSTTEFTLPPNGSVKVASPGYPSLLCPFIECSYSLKMEKAAGAHEKHAFAITTTHLSQHIGDVLHFVVDGETVNLEQFLKTAEQGLNLLYTDSLQVNYMASSVLSLNHGFSMTIEAIQVPLDCLCPSDRPKLLDPEGSFSMTIPVHCPLTICRFNIPNYPQKDRIFQLEMNYTLSNPLEIIHMEDGVHDHVIRQLSDGSRQEFTKLEYVANETVVLTYMRASANQSSVDSSFSMRWEWLTDDECSCGRDSFVASSSWRPLFSPRFPQDYCVNMDCTYTITAPSGHHVAVSMLAFNTEPHSDFLSIFDGKPSQESLIERLSGKINRKMLESNGTMATLHFTSDSSVTAKGFKILYYAIPDDDFVVDENSNPLGTILVVLAILALFILVSLLAYKKLLCFKYWRVLDVESLENPMFEED